MEFLRRLMQPIIAVWSKLGQMARVAILVTAVICLAAIVWVGWWSTQDEFGVLLRDVEANNAGEITRQLESQNVPYELSEDGRTISVPVQRVTKVRMDLAVDGYLVGSGKGYELFDESSFGMTPFEQNVNLVRAIQGELRRTIKELDPVLEARVAIVQPEPTPFIRDEEPVTAGIMVTRMPGVKFSRDAIRGIVSLVSGSVKGLSKENVTIIDSTGVSLTDHVESPQPDKTDNKLQIQRETESYLAEKGQNVLSPLFGPGQAVVRVSVDMSFTDKKTVEDRYDPDGRVAEHEMAKTITVTKPPGPRGVAGAASNLSPVVPTAFNTNDEGDREEETIETDYKITTTHTESEDKSGTIERLTVAVLVTPPEGKEGDEEQRRYSSVTKPHLAELVKQAVGFKDGRDAIEVWKFELAPPPVKPVPIPIPTIAIPWWKDFLTILAIVSGILMALLGCLIWWLGRRRSLRTIGDGQYSAEDLQLLRKIAQILKIWLGA